MVGCDGAPTADTPKAVKPRKKLEKKRVPRPSDRAQPLGAPPGWKYDGLHYDVV